MSSAIPHYVSAGTSDRGFVRPNNEDRVYCDDARGFFLVVDGMGGHEAGEHAADIAVQCLKTRLERQTGSAEQRLREAITLANNAIYEAAQERAEWNGMACVATAAIIQDGLVTVGHVGDTRLYRIKRGLIEKVTHDHSPVGEREDSGELSEVEAMQHPRRNEVYRDIGSEEQTPDSEEFIEILHFPFASDTALLLCSDGLSDAISSREILKIVEAHAGNRQSALRALIAAANEVGKDNVSAVLVEGGAFASSFGGADRGDITERLTASHSAWYRRAPAYMFYGAVLGAAILFAVQTFLPSANHRPASRVLLVTAPATISSTLERARPGDIVSVAPGTYAEAVTLREGVELISQHERQAIIQGPVAADGVQKARLEGFQIRGGAVGVRIRDSDVIVSRNEIADARGEGVEFDGNSRGAIFACAIHNNAGAGIVVGDAASPAIENNLLRDNGSQPSGLRPGLFIRSSFRPSVVANVFAGNGAEAIWLPAADEPMMQRNYFLSHGSPDRRPSFRIVPLQEGKP